MRPLRAAIVTIEQDLHALAVRSTLEERHGASCVVVESDALADSGGLTWSDPPEAFGATLPVRGGGTVAVEDLDVIWMRRLQPAARIPAEVTDPGAIEVITNDCRTTLMGILLTAFRGAWVSHPDANRWAENKLLQLRAARGAGFRVPRTLVSQDPEHIRRFCASQGDAVVVKALSGTLHAPLTTGIMTEELLSSDPALRLSPTIYQELVPGTEHLRVQAFGDDIRAVRISCPHLDWRFKLAESVVEPHPVPDALKRRLSEVLARLGLRMGIFDLKLAPDGEPIWLEVNPQGQWLFVEGLTGMPVVEHFADFLVREARSAGRTGRSASGVAPGVQPELW